MNLELRHLSFKYGSEWVLNDVSCHIQSAQAVALIGPSGGGKSTLLRLLAGLLVPESGSILLDGRAVPRHETDLLHFRRHIGVVFQAYNLFPHLTALQNIMLPLRVAHNQDPHEAQITAENLLVRLGLEKFRHQHPGQLSGGQRQRVAIARALATQPRLLLLDEPTSALDPEMTAEVLDLIEELKVGGCPFVIVTHSMGFARRVADQVVFLAGNQILESGPAEKVFDLPQTELCRRFLKHVLKY